MNIEDYLREENLILKSRIKALENEVLCLNKKLGNRGIDGKTPTSRCSLKKRSAVMNITDGKCFYCGKPAASIDHLVARSFGGKNHMNNLVPSCLQCNGRKGSSRASDAQILEAKLLHRKFYERKTSIGIDNGPLGH